MAEHDGSAANEIAPPSTWRQRQRPHIQCSGCGQWFHSWAEFEDHLPATHQHDEHEEHEEAQAA